MPEGECRAVEAWQSTADFADAAHVSHPLPSFARDGRYYVHTKTKDGADERLLYMAAQNGDGSLGPWQVASPDHGGGPHGYTAIVAGGEAYHFRNGHIARYPLGADGVMTGDVELLEDSTATAFGGNLYVWDSAAFADLGAGTSFIVHLGGFSFEGYEYRPHVYRSAVPPGPSFTSLGVNHPASRPGKTAFFRAPVGGTGFLYTGESGADGLWRAVVAADGSLSAWVELGALPAGTGNGRGDFWVAGRTLFVARGTKVFAADIDPAGGALSPWKEMPDLPVEQIDVTWGDGHLEGASSGVMGAWVYLTGPKAVLFAPLVPVSCEPSGSP